LIAGLERESTLHWREQPVPWLAGVSEIGSRHHENQDALAVAGTVGPGELAVLVVCDGVSSAPGSAKAALVAARASRDVLAGLHPAGTLDPDDEEDLDQQSRADRTETLELPSIDPAEQLRYRRQAELVRQLQRATRAASREVVALADGRSAQYSPACTLVSALVESGTVAVGWLGDSRAYWIPDRGRATCLTEDDSWVAEQIAFGMAPEVAARSPQAHAITRWLGAGGPRPVPRTKLLELTEPGWLLLCSDGLWNYCPSDAELEEVFDQAVQAGSAVEADWDRATAEPLDLAERLTGWAVERGGRDNITVALARLAPA
jgi:serine/threonine protein phosphatase PrpC